MNIDIFKSFFKVLTPIDFQMFMNLLEIQTVRLIYYHKFFFISLNLLHVGDCCSRL